MLAIRSTVFYVGYVSVTIVWGTLSVLIAWAMPLGRRYDFIIGIWTRMVLKWLQVVCGIRVRVSGIERIPAEPCIFLVRHESTWETLWVPTLASPQAPLVKRELLRIPFWGWAFAMVRPIAIDRGKPSAALRRFIAAGQDRLERGMYVALFPEGTRLPSGQPGRFYRGGAALAAATGTPLVVIAHDAGRFWPARKFLKAPGEITVVISEPISVEGIKSSELNKMCEDWLRTAMLKLPAASPQPGSARGSPSQEESPDRAGH